VKNKTLADFQLVHEVAEYIFNLKCVDGYRLFLVKKDIVEKKIIQPKPKIVVRKSHEEEFESEKRFSRMKVMEKLKKEDIKTIFKECKIFVAKKKTCCVRWDFAEFCITEKLENLHGCVFHEQRIYKFEKVKTLMKTLSSFVADGNDLLSKFRTKINGTEYFFSYSISLCPVEPPKICKVTLSKCLEMQNYKSKASFILSELGLAWDFKCFSDSIEFSIHNNTEQIEYGWFRYYPK